MVTPALLRKVTLSKRYKHQYKFYELVITVKWLILNCHFDTSVVNTVTQTRNENVLC